MFPPAWSSDAVIPTQHTVSTDPPASTKVFNIAELLELVLRQIPIEHLTALRPVARAWNDIILEINHISSATVGHADWKCVCLGSKETCIDIPHYFAGRFAIRGNSAFRYTHIHRMAGAEHDDGLQTGPTTLRHYRGISLKSWEDTLEKEDGSGYEFITNPPITVVALENSGFGYTCVKAMLRVTSGIRVSDLREVFAKTDYVVDDHGHIRQGSGRPSAWYACTSGIARGTGDTGNGEDERKDGNDVGAEMGSLSIAS